MHRRGSVIALSIKLIPPTPALKLFSMGTPLPEWDAATMHVVCGSALVQQGEMARIRSCAALSRRIVLVVQLSFSFIIIRFRGEGRRRRRRAVDFPCFPPQTDIIHLGIVPLH